MSFGRSNCRWLLGGIFFLSLAVNVFLAGWLFGDDGFSTHAPKPPRGLFFESFNEKAKSLAEPQRSAVQDVLSQYQPQLKKRMKRVMKAREEIDALLRSPNYSREEAETAFDRLQQYSYDAQELAQDMMLDIADALPPQDRASFLERPKETRGRGAEFKSKPKPSASHHAPVPAAQTQGTTNTTTSSGQ